MKLAVKLKIRVRTQAIIVCTPEAAVGILAAVIGM